MRRIEKFEDWKLQWFANSLFYFDVTLHPNFTVRNHGPVSSSLSVAEQGIILCTLMGAPIVQALSLSRYLK